MASSPPIVRARRPCLGLQPADVTHQLRYVTENKAMPKGCQPDGEQALSNAERQARHRARLHQAKTVIRFAGRRTTDRPRAGAMPSPNWRLSSPSILHGSIRFPTACMPLRQERRWSHRNLDLDALAEIDPPRGYGRD